MPAPKSGWTSFWHKMTALELLTLADASTLKGESVVPDGFSYVVEVAGNGRYRTYHYGNPLYQPWPQARKMLRIEQTLRREIPFLEYAVPSAQISSSTASEQK